MTVMKRIAWLAGALGIFFLLYVALRIVLESVQQPIRINPIVQILVDVALCLVSAVVLLGLRRAVVGFLTVASGGWLIEELAIVAFPQFFGAYYYTDVLGPKLGSVPLLIGLSWYMIIYMSHVMSNYIVVQRVEASNETFSEIAVLSLVGAFIATTYDLLFDPYMVNVQEAWVWTQGGPYFGIPLQNFVGWVATAFLLAFCFRWVNRSIPGPSVAQARTWIGVFPYAAYALFAISFAVIADPPGTRVIALIGMGSVTLATLPGFLIALSRFSPRPASLSR